MKPRIFLVEDHEKIRTMLRRVLEAQELEVSDYASAEDFLSGYNREQEGCLLLDIMMPGMTGLELQTELVRQEIDLPIIFISGEADVPMAVQALHSGAFDFLTKPIDNEKLVERVREALRRAAEAKSNLESLEEVRSRYEELTPREREVMQLVAEGLANKVIANRLSISERTVEVHRAHVMRKMKAESLADLVRMAIQLEEE